jgi:phosphotransferase system IIB component
MSKKGCVSKNRVHSMHKPHIQLTSKNNKIKFDVIDSMYLSEVKLMTTSIEMYYVMVMSSNTNNIYVLFSSGTVLTREDLYDNKELNNRLWLLIAKIIGIVKSNNKIKIILGGHSMGSVLSMYVGLLMYNNSKYKSIFIDNCYIFGTGSARWIINEHRDFTNLPNIRQYIGGEIRRGKKITRLLLDCYSIHGDTDFTSYEPYYLLYSDVIDNNGEITIAKAITLEDATEKQYVIEYPDKTTNICKKLHLWANYQKLLGLLYKDVELCDTKLSTSIKICNRNKSMRNRDSRNKERHNRIQRSQTMRNRTTYYQL